MLDQLTLTTEQMRNLCNKMWASLFSFTAKDLLNCF